MADTNIFSRLTAAVVTCSDSCAAGHATDHSGHLLVNLLKAAGWANVSRHVVPDDPRVIADLLILLASDPQCRLIVTTGGTGYGPHDVTPEATRQVIDREASSLITFVQTTTGTTTPFAWASRGTAGLRGRTLIINFPGSPKAVSEYWHTLSPILPHIIETMVNPGHHHDLEAKHGA